MIPGAIQAEGLELPDLSDILQIIQAVIPRIDNGHRILLVLPVMGENNEGTTDVTITELHELVKNTIIGTHVHSPIDKRRT